ncbi:MAG TPA: hypothetical protein VN025_08350 [Candidatus Dormibacteraeota bacterium]|jgi:hypothetical protein|nr:hypothetical protein [Candidatus Dormibacteraeota bacterium]
MDRKRALEIILAIVCILFIPGYLVNLYFSHRNAATAPETPIHDPQFTAAFDAGVALEKHQQYQEAISKFLEAEMIAGKMRSGKYPALETAIEHYRSCNAALGQQDVVQAASKQLIRVLFEDGDSLRNANQLEASVPKFQQVEEAAEGMNDFEVPIQDLARQRLVEVFWKLKRYSDADAAADRIIASVHQPLNDYDSALGEKYYSIAYLRSQLTDWQGMEKPLARATEEYDKTIASYPESNTGNARFAKAMAMYALATAYANQRKQDLALSAADNAFQYTVQVHSPEQLKKQIAQLGLQLANASKQKELITTWQARLADLPADPCPVPDIHNPNCITPVPGAAQQSTR